MPWFGNPSVKFRSRLQNAVRTAGVIIGMLALTSRQEILEGSVKKQSLKMIGDPSRVLREEYELRPSGRRYRVPVWKMNRYTFSLTPLLNNNE